MEELQKAMQGLQKAIGSAVSKDPKPASITSDSSLASAGPPAFSPDPSRLVLTRPPRNMVSLGTCSKVCAICFVAGVVVGYTLKRRVRRWASKLLRRIKDD
ncbi:hypothetical protein RJ639_021156 [Escallonia herrerae]|uniref:Uncharacterized protein n=1 Tax=Escallonia herrerae TaxID=1293975 RepID=A0AA88V4M9_9ASTE|nr:hypothetical protein RJ639_021156 [Escallonia herrerae]